MTHSRNYSTDLVTEIANERLPLWRAGLGRHVEYKREELGRLATKLHEKAPLYQLDADAEIDDRELAEWGFLHLECPWQTELYAKRHGGWMQ